MRLGVPGIQIQNIVAASGLWLVPLREGNSIGSKCIGPVSARVQAIGVIDGVACFMSQNSHAFRLHSRRSWTDTFGSYRVPYPEWYQPQPGSRDYVLNLDAWYAQAHPAEDFAETFAVWLQPRSNWRRRYRGWPALRKLEYVDELVNEIAGTRPRNPVRRKIETLPEIRITLREHYDRKREKYAFEWPAYLDNDLRRIFSPEPTKRAHETAAAFLRRVGPEIQQLVSEGTGVHGYAIDHVLELMIARAAQLKLRAVGREERLKRHLLIMLTVQTRNVVHSGYYRIAL